MSHRILLTGSNGLLGQKIVSLLADHPNVTLLATARGDNRHPQAEGYQYQSVDLTDAAAIREAVTAFAPTVVINTAAMTQVDACEDERQACDAINVEAVKVLCDVARQQAMRLVHLSTDFVFDGQDGPYRESDLPKPVNYYGESKLRAERLIRQAGLDHAVLRTILLYGVTPAMSRSNIVLWAKQSLEAGKNIRVVNDQHRSPTLAEDLAAATVTAALGEMQGIYHVSGAEYMGVHEIAYAVADYWQLDRGLITEIDSHSLKQRARRPPNTGFVIDKARAELAYQPRELTAGFALLDQQLKAL
jgi:dTDP-4-dehydrorhamnose reductase